MTALIRSILRCLQGLQRFGSLLKPLSAKKSCSPAVKINSWAHSMHKRVLSLYSTTADPPRDRVNLSPPEQSKSFLPGKALPPQLSKAQSKPNTGANPNTGMLAE